MNRKNYIAYGSNLNLAKMKRRYPDAKFIGTAMIDDFQLVFKGNEHSTYAIFEACVNAKVPADISEITEKMETVIYMMNAGLEYALPKRDYFHDIEQGYHDCHLDEKYLNEALQNMMNRVQNQTIEEKYPSGYRDIRQ